MRKHLPFAAVLILALTSIAFAQEAQPAASPSPKPKPRMSKAQLLKKLSASETKLWDAWKNKDAKPFQAWLVADSVVVGEQGVAGKGDITKMMAEMPCDVKSFSLSDWKLSMIDPNAALITYKGTAQGTCAGQVIPAVWASSVWVNRKGKWMAFSHQETPVKP